MPSPFQQSGHNKEVLEKPSKVSRLTSGATVAAAIVEAENSLEIDVSFPASEETFFRTNIWAMSLAEYKMHFLSC